MHGLKDNSHLEMLLDKFKLDPNIGTKQMSLGVKRKLAVVTAFMHDPDILILDEPTSGLDPIMQDVFIDYILEEKKRGKTIFLSSHIFREIDVTCDRIAIIKDGKIVSEFIADDLKNRSDKVYRVTFKDMESYNKFAEMPYQFSSKNPAKLRARVHVEDSNINQFITDITKFDIADLHEFPFTLEDYFMQFYKADRTFEGGEIMSDNIIKIENLTKDYGQGRGIFDISLDVPKGQVFGYVGTNGSGKTTTIRHMMGFVNADSGNVTINGMNAWKDSTQIMNYVSYVPGEIAFPGLATGTDFLKLQAEYLGITDFTYMNHVISLLQLDPTANLKRMSKGMKQKTASFSKYLCCQHDK